VYIVALTDNQSKYADYNHWDSPLAAGYLVLAARALGHGTVFIIDVIPDAITKKVLNTPDRYTRACITPLGVPVAWPDSPTKKPLEDFIAWETL
jgi:nitroreductase